MVKLLRDRVKSVYDDLSPSFQLLADYLLDHPYEAAFMTATELGRVLEVDTATVVRFAQRLDYPGFPELLDEIQAQVKQQLVRYFQPSEDDRSRADPFFAALHQDVKNIEQFNLTLDTATVARVLSMIGKAERILVVGEGMLSAPLAHMLADALRALFYNATALPTDAGSIATEFRSLGAGDLVIAVAVTHYCPDVTSIMEVANERGAQTIGLVGAMSWSIARALDVVIVCPNKGPSNIASVAAFSVVINALFQALFQERREAVLDRSGHFEATMHRLTEARARFEFVRPAWAAEQET